MLVKSGLLALPAGSAVELNNRKDPRGMGPEGLVYCLAYYLLFIRLRALRNQVAEPSVRVIVIRADALNESQHTRVVVPLH